MNLVFKLIVIMKKDLRDRKLNQFHIFPCMYLMHVWLWPVSNSFQTPPTADEAGYCDHVYVDEIGETPVIVFRQGEVKQLML